MSKIGDDYLLRAHNLIPYLEHCKRMDSLAFGELKNET